MKKIIKTAIQQKDNVLLIGESGTGKTTFLRELAKNENKTLYRLNMSGMTGTDDLMGKWIMRNGNMDWMDGLLIRAMKNGDWIVLDELNMAHPDILSILHSLLDDERAILLKEKDGEKIVPADGFMFFATMNPSSLDYSGTKAMNKAFISRFACVIQADIAKNEKEIISEKSGLSGELLNNIMILADELRQAKNKELISYSPNTRDLIGMARYCLNGLPIKDSFDISILNKIEELDEKEKIKEVFNLIFGQKYKNIKNNKEISISEHIAEMEKTNAELSEKIKELENSTNAIKIKELENIINETTNELEKEQLKNEELKNKNSELLNNLQKIKEYAQS